MRSSGDPAALRWILLVGAVWLAGFILLLVLPPRGTLRFVADCMGWVALGVLVGVLSTRRAAREPDAATGWRLVSAGGWTVAAVSAVDALLWIRYGYLPLPLVVITIMDNATWVFLLAGLLSWTGRAHRTDATARAALDATLLAASFFLIAWWNHGAKLAAVPEVSFGRVVRSAVPFALTSAGLGLVAFLAARSADRLKGPLSWFGVGYLLLLAGALTYAWATMRGIFYPGHALDALSQLPLFAIALAPASRHPFPAPIEADDAGSAVGDALTVMPAAVGLIVVAVESLAGAPLDMLSRVVCIAVVALLLARQTLAIGDVRHLSRTLEDRVQERTQALAHSQMALARAQRMEAIGRLAGGIAHDFNNYLTAIAGHAELLKDEFDPRHPAHGSTESIREAARSGGELAKRLLSFARPTANSPRLVTAEEALARACQFTRGIARGRVNVDAHAPEPDAAVYMDPILLDQVLTNLLTNAIDATPCQGSVWLAAERVSVATPLAGLGLAPGRYLRFSVTDSGSGMDEATMSLIFEPFFTTKGGDRGSGLGLPTAYSIVKQAGGSISVQSKPGSGSRFEVFLREADGVPGRMSATGAGDARNRPAASPRGDATHGSTTPAPPVS